MDESGVAYRMLPYRPEIPPDQGFQCSVIAIIVDSQAQIFLQNVLVDSMSVHKIFQRFFWCKQHQIAFGYDG